jgi:hypothetical protein
VGQRLLPSYWAYTRGPFVETMDLHTLDPQLVHMVKNETEAALVCLHRVHGVWSLDALDIRVKRVGAVIVLIEEVETSYPGHGYSPREVVPWLKCSAQLLARTQGRELNPAREHVSAACDLLFAFSG